MTAPPFFTSAFRGDKHLWGHTAGPTVYLWESLSEEERKICVTEISSPYKSGWIIFCRQRPNASSDSEDVKCLRAWGNLSGAPENQNQRADPIRTATTPNTPGRPTRSRLMARQWKQSEEDLDKRAGGSGEILTSTAVIATWPAGWTNPHNHPRDCWTISTKRGTKKANQTSASYAWMAWKKNTGWVRSWTIGRI